VKVAFWLSLAGMATGSLIGFGDLAAGAVVWGLCWMACRLSESR
jgi:hypothetical protein